MVNIFWFRRDLRLDDNHGLYKALKSGLPVQPLFIFDSEILNRLTDKNDPRVQFIYNQLFEIHQTLKKFNAGLQIEIGKPTDIFARIIQKGSVKQVFANQDFEPYGQQRDHAIQSLLISHGIDFHLFKDHVIFAPGEILKADNLPYTVFTPFSKRWKLQLSPNQVELFDSLSLMSNFAKSEFIFPDLEATGFKPASIQVPAMKIEASFIGNYANNRNFPSLEGTSFAGTHLRFGTVSIRRLVKLALQTSETWLNELIWREFFMHILFHFPHSANKNFYRKYDHLQWLNDESAFEAWTAGKTGYPLVDAGMRELLATGLMHNRVRMVTASFLTKHLLIDWRWGEAWFASKLLDYEMASNVGNWQWAAGTGCDAAPYFRVFNPTEQLKKFDPHLNYIRKWLPEFDSFGYRQPIVQHSFARDRALLAYKKALTSQL